MLIQLNNGSIYKIKIVCDTGKMDIKNNGVFENMSLNVED